MKGKKLCIFQKHLPYVGRDDAGIGNADNQRKTGTVYERLGQYIDSEQYGLSGSDRISNRDEENRGGIYRINENGVISDTEKQVGKMSESFSNSLSMEKEGIKCWKKKLFRISMIPSAMSLLRWLIPLIW